MDTGYVTSKMNEFMFRLGERMGAWLGDSLPKITENWWQEIVLNNLSTLQLENVRQKNITDLNRLDLAALLRVVDRNWFVITSKFFINNKEREHIKDMQQVRNTWAHITPTDITKKRVLMDVQTILDLMQAFDAKMPETNDMELFLMDVEKEEAFSTEKQEQKVETPVELPHVEPAIEEEDNSEIKAGDMVLLVNDQKTTGVVTRIDGRKFYVFLDGKEQTFYREQIEKKKTERKADFLSIRRVKSALTAYQINNPGSSNLYSLNSARIDFVPYQFRPALKMIQADIPKVLVADDVGVGKTIEAGLILKELEARSGLSSVLVICPRPLVAERKWQLEMKRFDENFTQLDGQGFAECIMETDRDGEWPERHSKTIIPYSLFSEDSVMGRQSSSNKKKKSLGLSELDPLPHFDLVIVDEAHNIRNSNTWGYRGVELFTRNADAVVFLTATPLQNSNNDLYTLLNLLRPDIILDKDTFNTMSEPNMYINNLLRIVRSQEDGWQESGKVEISNILGTTWGRNVIQHNPEFETIYEYFEKGEVSREEKIDLIAKIERLHSFHALINRTRRRDIEDFCIRRTMTLNVPFNSVQQDLYCMLMEFESSALVWLHGGRNIRFMMCTIMRQAASCIFGLAPYMGDIVAKRLNQIREDGEFYDQDDIEFKDDEWEELMVLAEDIRQASTRLPSEDPKFDRMYEVIQEKQSEDNNRVIIFSSFRHTLTYIQKKLEERSVRVGRVDGKVPDDERFKLRERFLMNRDEDGAIDVLLFSEVGCEGLDYQFCDTMINYDLPWNPMRIEQRIGRIDRRGQKSDTVKIYNMITDDTIDAVIYDRCLSKIGVFEASIGDCSDILGDISNQILQIMFDPGLTDEERKLKIEKMADNEVMKIKEMQRLEQEEKSLFGFDLSNYVQNKDVQDAENTWISPGSMMELVNLFMNDFLGEGEYLRGKQDIKTLRLSAEKRQLLLDHLKHTKLVNSNDASKLWKAYLKSDKPQLSVTFDSTCAKDNRNVAFLTQMHPLVIQAAAYESQNFPCEFAVRIADPEIPPGDYEFLVYAWRYTGLRPDIKLVAVSENEAVEKNVLNFIQYASEYEGDNSDHGANWDEMDNLHYDRWQEAKGQYTTEVKAECDYRVEQLGQSYHQQSAILQSMIDRAEDERIRRMRQSQKDNLTKKFNQQEKEFSETAGKADIHSNLLVKGLLHVD